MRKNVTTKERTIVEEVVTYVANDGTVFRSEDECKKYETTAKCAIKAMFKGVPKITVDGYDFMDKAAFFANGDDDIIAIYLNTLDDIEATNKWLLNEFGENGEEFALFSSADLGTIQFLEVYWGDHLFYMLGTADSLKKRYCDHIDSMVVKLKGESEKEKS